MSLFKEVTKTVSCKEKDTVEVSFELTKQEDVSKIVNVSASCGCINPSYDITGGAVKVTMRAGEIPQHLVAEGNNAYETKKYVKVEFQDGSEELLTIDAVVSK